MFVQASAFPLALLAVFLYKRSISRESIGLGPTWFSTQRESPCASSVLAHQAPLGSGTCRRLRCAEKAGWVQHGSTVINTMFQSFKMVSMWKLAVSQGFCWAVGEIWPEMRLFPAVVSQV